MTLAETHATLTLADELHRYVKFRAEKQGFPYDLDAKFFAGYIKARVRGFFGVETTSTRIVRDTQRADLLAEWKSL
jgi:hypothetical protein